MICNRTTEQGNTSRQEEALHRHSKLKLPHESLLYMQASLVTAATGEYAPCWCAGTKTGCEDKPVKIERRVGLRALALLAALRASDTPVAAAAPSAAGPAAEGCVDGG